MSESPAASTETTLSSLDLEQADRLRPTAFRGILIEIGDMQKAIDELKLQQERQANALQQVERRESRHKLFSEQVRAYFCEPLDASYFSSGAWLFYACMIMLASLCDTLFFLLWVPLGALMMTVTIAPSLPRPSLGSIMIISLACGMAVLVFMDNRYLPLATPFFVFVIAFGIPFR